MMIYLIWGYLAASTGVFFAYYAACNEISNAESVIVGARGGAGENLGKKQRYFRPPRAPTLLPILMIKIHKVSGGEPVLRKPSYDYELPFSAERGVRCFMSTTIAGAASAIRPKERMSRRPFSLGDKRQLRASLAQETQRLHQLRTGEADAWTQLLAEWSPCLYTYLTATLGDEAAAQQALQTLFSHLVQRVMGGAPIVNLPLLILTLAEKSAGSAPTSVNFRKVDKGEMKKL